MRGYLSPHIFITAAANNQKGAHMASASFGSEDFDIEMGDFEVKKTKLFERTWRVGPGGSIMTRPLVIGDTICFGSFNQNMHAVSAGDGRLIWKFQATGPIGASAPVWDGVRLCFGSYDYNVYALDPGTGRLLWKFKTEGAITRTGCADEDSFYIGSRDGYIYSIEKDSGRMKWKFRTYGSINSAVATMDGRVFVGSYDQNFYCLNAEGRLLWKIATQGEINSCNPPLVTRGRVYFASFDNFVYAADVETGRVLWKLKMSDYGNSVSPVESNGVIYHGSRDGCLYAISLEGRVIWKFRSAFPEAVSSPVIEDGMIFLGSGDYNMYCLDMSGRELWRFPTQGHVWWQPASWKKSLLFSSWDCNLYSVNKRDGMLNWKFRSAGSPCYVPPPFEAFRVQVRIPKSHMEEMKKKGYELEMQDEGEKSGSFYKSRVTYHVSTQYREKGKYQVSDSDDF